MYKQRSLCLALNMLNVLIRRWTELYCPQSKVTNVNSMSIYSQCKILHKSPAILIIFMSYHAMSVLALTVLIN